MKVTKLDNKKLNEEELRSNQNMHKPEDVHIHADIPYGVARDEDTAAQEHAEEVYDALEKDASSVTPKDPDDGNVKIPKNMYAEKIALDESLFTEDVDDVDKGEVVAFLKDSVEWLIEEGVGCSTYKLDDRLGICVGWESGFDADGEDIIHAQDEPTWAIVAGIKVYTSDDMRTDYDWINYPYFANGDVEDTGVSISPNENYDELAAYFIDEFENMKDWYINKDGLVIETEGHVDDVEESLSRGKKLKESEDYSNYDRKVFENGDVSWLIKTYPTEGKAFEKLISQLGYGPEDYIFDVITPPGELKIIVYPPDDIDKADYDKLKSDAAPILSKAGGVITEVTPYGFDISFPRKETNESLSPKLNKKLAEAKRFKSMSLEDAKKFYSTLKDAKDLRPNDSFLGKLLDDVWNNTKGLTQDYGGVSSDEKSDESCKGKKRSKKLKESRKQLNEGPGAGYTIKATTSCDKINSIAFVDCSKVGSGGYVDVECDCDIDATTTDIQAESAYYGTSRAFAKEEIPSKITGATLSVNIDNIIDELGIEVGEDEDTWNKSKEEILSMLNNNIEALEESIFDALVGIETDIVYGGGWSHSTYDGTITDGDIDSSSDYSIFELYSVAIQLTDKEAIEYIDRAVTGENQREVFYVVIDGDWEEGFTDETEAIEYAQSHDGEKVVRTYDIEEYGGDINFSDYVEVVWEADDYDAEDDEDEWEDDEANESLSPKHRREVRESKKHNLEPRKRTAPDGKVWWVAYDTDSKKYSTITTIGKYENKKDCQYAIDKYNKLNESKELTEAFSQSDIDYLKSHKGEKLKKGKYSVEYNEYVDARTNKPTGGSFTLYTNAGRYGKDRTSFKDADELIKYINRHFPVNESKLTEKKGKVEGEDDNVYQLVYDALFLGNKNFRPHIADEAGEVYDWEQSLIMLPGYNDYDLGIALEKEEDGKYAKAVADKLGLKYEIKPTSSLSDGYKFIATVRIPDDIANKDATEYVTSIGLDMNTIRPKKTKKK